MLSLYNKYILPRRLDRDMKAADFNEARSAVVNPACGVVLEVGFGSGYNLPFYTNVTKLYALDPSQELYEYAKSRVDAVPFPVEYLSCSAEDIPLDDNSIDTAVSTWTLCSIPDLPKALREIHRVLKPGGRFLFVEHGKSPKHVNAVVQTLVTPVSRLYAGNCHLNRKIDEFITDAGFVIEDIEMSPEERRPLMFSYQGIAVKEA